MAPLPPSASTSNPPENNNRVPSTAANVPCSCIFSSRRVSFPPPSRTRDASSLSEHFVSAVEGFLGALTAAASRNPFLKSVLSLSASVQSFCQMQSRNLNSLKSRNLNSLSSHNFAAILPGDSVAGVVVANGLTNFFNLYNTLLICRIVLTWFPGAPPVIVSPLSTICDPYLNIFRGIIPPLGGTLDLSPILAFLVLNAFTSTAAALPAELPGTRTSQHGLHGSQLPSGLTTVQQKWMRRLSGKQNKNLKGN